MGKTPDQEQLAAAVERLRVVDSYGIEWGKLLTDRDTDPQMARDVVIVVREFLRREDLAASGEES